MGTSGWRWVARAMPSPWRRSPSVRAAVAAKEIADMDLHRRLIRKDGQPSTRPTLLQSCRPDPTRTSAGQGLVINGGRPALVGRPLYGGTTWPEELRFAPDSGARSLLTGRTSRDLTVQSRTADQLLTSPATSTGSAMRVGQ